MKTEILMIGTELLIGQIQDTNATFMARALAENGINLYQKGTVGDNPERIRAALDDGLNRSDVILCSGGLGPTEDDITRECIAELLDRPLEYHEELFEAIRRLFAHIGRPATENNKRQAMVPRGGQPIPNPNGTAPGLIVDDPRGIIICMPGVPKELEPMLVDQVIPWLRARFGMQGILHSRVLKVCGMGESRVDHVMGDMINACQNPTIGLLASPDAVRIRITAHAATKEEAERLIEPVAREIYARLPGDIMGEDDATLEGAVDALLAAKGWRLAVGETQTGGTLAQRLVAVASNAFAGGRIYPVSEQPLDRLEAWASEQAHALRTEFNAECALVLASNVTERRAFAVLETPAGGMECSLGFYGSNRGNQVRCAVIALENTRKFLMAH